MRDLRPLALALTLALNCVVIGLTGCGEDDPPAADPAPPATPVEAPSETSTPSAPAVDPDEPGEFVAPSAPESGCAFGESSVAWRRPGWFDVAAGPRGFLVGGSASHGAYEMAFLTAVNSGGGSHVLAQQRLEAPVPDGHRRAAPALAADDEHGALALVDGQQRLLIARFVPRAASALNFAVVAEGASLRFSPALARHEDAWWIAWTEERGEDGRRVLAMRVPDQGDVPEPQDLTPEAGGAAAPAFVAGLEPPTLIFLDAREGTSVAHRARVAGETFGPTEVARPVSAVTDPPQIAAVRIGQNQFLSYTGIGSAATTAVGFVPLAGTDQPTPVVPGTGYGVLHVDADALGGGAVVVADAPLESAPTAPRELRVRRVTSSGAMSEPSVVRGPSESTVRGRVAALGEVIAVAFGSDVGVHVSVGRCAAPSAAPSPAP